MVAAESDAIAEPGPAVSTTVTIYTENGKSDGEVAEIPSSNGKKDQAGKTITRF